MAKNGIGFQVLLSGVFQVLFSLLGIFKFSIQKIGRLYGRFSNYNCVKEIIPEAPSCSVLTLLGIYLVARIFRIYGLEDMDMVSNMLGIYEPVAFLAVSVAIFSISFALDIPRRLVISWLLKKRA